MNGWKPDAATLTRPISRLYRRPGAIAGFVPKVGEYHYEFAGHFCGQRPVFHPGYHMTRRSTLGWSRGPDQSFPPRV